MATPLQHSVTATPSRGDVTAAVAHWVWQQFGKRCYPDAPCKIVGNDDMFGSSRGSHVREVYKPNNLCSKGRWN
jgi:hypothetical protein